MPNNGKQEGENSRAFSLELVAMVAVIAISSWHIGNYMSTFDGWVMATIMGATLGFCNFLCAHNIFKEGSTSRFPSFAGMVFFAITSTWMQYTYFNKNPDIGVTLIYSVNLDALALGIWAPAAEILLGWIYAANLRKELPISRHAPQPLPFRSLAQVVTQRIEQALDSRTHPEQRRSSEPHMNTIAVQSSTDMFNTDVRSNGDDIHMNDSEFPKDIYRTGEKLELSKSEAMGKMLNLFAVNPHATYEQVAAAIGRSKSTVANYVRELKEEGKVQISDEQGVQVYED